ncbi:MAG: GNAT family N-acetyltransferase [Chloroflexi bacterium]|nr:GNAT family N-acetyltransferase [Chloroflexota bacterium]
MKLTMRLYQTEDDWWRIREFLRAIFLLNGRREWSWHVARLDYWRWHGVANLGDGKLDRDVFIWETTDGQIAAVLNREESGHAFLQTHPGFRAPELEAEMIGVAEERLTRTRADGKRVLCVWTDSRDDLRHAILSRRGYVKRGEAEHQWRRALDAPIPDAPLASGYTIRALGDGLELLERCYASGLGFHNGDIKIAVDNRRDPTWYRNIQTAPLYRRDLDLIAVASSGEIASFTTIWFDDVTRSAHFEPVATVPAHQRRGLGKAVMTEGLRRLKRMGALVAFVGGYSPEANALYASVMGNEFDLSEPWVRE